MRIDLQPSNRKHFVNPPGTEGTPPLAVPLAQGPSLSGWPTRVTATAQYVLILKFFDGLGFCFSAEREGGYLVCVKRRPAGGQI